MRRRSHARVPTMPTAELDNLVRIRGDNYVVQQRRGSNTLVHASKQSLAGNLAQHFARQPGRRKPRWNDRNGFHAISVNFLRMSCNRGVGSLLLAVIGPVEPESAIPSSPSTNWPHSNPRPKP